MRRISLYRVWNRLTLIPYPPAPFSAVHGKSICFCHTVHMNEHIHIGDIIFLVLIFKTADDILLIPLFKVVRLQIFHNQLIGIWNSFKWLNEWLFNRYHSIIENHPEAHMPQHIRVARIDSAVPGIQKENPIRSV